jgi:hypothetical protein
MKLKFGNPNFRGLPTQDIFIGSYILGFRVSFMKLVKYANGVVPIAKVGIKHQSINQ